MASRVSSPVLIFSTRRSLLVSRPHSPNLSVTDFHADRYNIFSQLTSLSLENRHTLHRLHLSDRLQCNNPAPCSSQHPHANPASGVNASTPSAFVMFHPMVAQGIVICTQSTEIIFTFLFFSAEKSVRACHLCGNCLHLDHVGRPLTPPMNLMKRLVVHLPVAIFIILLSILAS